MNRKALAGYLTILALSFLLHSVKPGSSVYYSALPAAMLIFPIIAGYRVKIRFSLRDTALGLIVSGLILFPYYLISGGQAGAITVYSIVFQLLSVAFPEEFFFRGFLQDSIGRTFSAVLLVSLMFSLAHMPKAIFFGDWISLLSFFPSLIMGWLYMRTNNIIPGAVFHLLANLVYQTTHLRSL